VLFPVILVLAGWISLKMMFGHRKIRDVDLCHTYARRGFAGENEECNIDEVKDSSALEYGGSVCIPYL
jgi:hypothetical protein